MVVLTTAMLHRGGWARAGAGAVLVPVVRERRLGRAGLAGPQPGLVPAARLCRKEAARRGFGRLVLDVLPARTAVIGFYRRLGYAECEPFATESPAPMIYMQRLIP